MKKRILTILGLALTIVLINTLIANALEIDPSLKPINQPFSETNDKDPAGSLVTILQIIAGGLLYFAAPLTIIMITFIGIDLNIGGADSEKIDQFKKNLTWLIIGLILIIMSYSFVKFVITVAVKSADNI